MIIFDQHHILDGYGRFPRIVDHYIRQTQADIVNLYDALQFFVTNLILIQADAYDGNHKGDRKAEPQPQP
jgi:hypothetical protein